MTFLRNCWYAAIWDQDLGFGVLVPRKIIGEPVVLYRTPAGTPVALSNICPHRFAPLHMGRLLPDGGVACGYHGLEFRQDGVCAVNPHDGNIPKTCRVRSYRVVAKDSMLWIWMGDAEPDLSQIPDFHFLDPTAGYDIVPRDQLRLECDYRLIMSNLLDLSHVSFLHDGILGNAETITAKIDVQVTDDTVEVRRDSYNAPPPKLFDLLFKNDGAPVDLWNSMRWNAPANLRNDAGVCAPGAARSDGAGILSAHLLTPESETSTLYFIAAARQKTSHRSDKPMEDIRSQLTELRRIAFELQDTPMIQAQQAMMKDYPELTQRPLHLAIDAAPNQAQAMLNRRIGKEQAAALASN